MSSRVAAVACTVLTVSALSACSTSHPDAASPKSHVAAAPTTSPPPVTTSPTTDSTTTRPAPASTTSVPQVAGLPAGHVLAGKTIGIDPGHNGLNYTDPSFLNQQINNGREDEDCDTTGTETNTGYTEPLFNWNIATYLSADLESEGARVVLTRPSNDGVGPCVTTRADIINAAGAAVAVDIHADGGPTDGRGFAILEPVADGPNDGVIGASDNFALILRQSFEQETGMPVSTYDGVDGLQPRNDLAGLNLTTVPKVLIECGNMRNSTDAALLTSTTFQKNAALAMALAITRFLGSV